jgi:hypothetical protein
VALNREEWRIILRPGLTKGCRASDDDDDDDDDDENENDNS